MAMSRRPIWTGGLPKTPLTVEPIWPRMSSMPRGPAVKGVRRSVAGVGGALGWARSRSDGRFRARVTGTPRGEDAGGDQDEAADRDGQDADAGVERPEQVRPGEPQREGAEREPRQPAADPRGRRLADDREPDDDQRPEEDDDVERTGQPPGVEVADAGGADDGARPRQEHPDHDQARTGHGGP